MLTHRNNYGYENTPNFVESMWIFKFKIGADFHFLSIILVGLVTVFGNGSVRAQSAPFLYDAESFLSNLPLFPSTMGIGDINADGIDELILGNASVRPRAYFFSKSEGKFFPDSMAELSSRVYPSIAHMPILDVNGDGVRDIFMVHQNNDTTAIFTWNGTDFKTLRRPTIIRPIDNIIRTHISFADFNKDGLLDLLLGRNAAGRIPNNNVIYNVLEMEGLPGFNDTSSEVRLQYAANSSNYISDFDNDGFLDFYKLNTGTDRARIFKGSQNGFITQTTSQISVIGWSYSAFVSDFNNDGYMDVYRGTIAALQGTPTPLFNILFRNLGNFQFDTPDAGAAILEQKDSYSVSGGDPDNDGDIDLIVADFRQTLSYYENDGNGRFTKVNLDATIINGNWQFAEMVDFDDDGRLDLLCTTQSGIKSRFYRNNANRSNKWIKFDLKNSNTVFKEPLGARLILEATINGRLVKQTRDIMPSNGSMIFRSYVQHFGLGNASAAATLTVLWPSGLKQIIALEPSQFNQKITLVEPQRGKLALLNSATLQASTGTTVTDSIRFRNVGKSDVRISRVNGIPQGISIRPTSVTIQPGKTGGFMVSYIAADGDGTNLITRSLTAVNDGVVDSISFTVNTRNLGKEAPFTSQTGSGSFFTGGDRHAVAGAADIFEADSDSLEFISVTDNNQFRLFSRNAPLTFVEKSFPFSGSASAVAKGFSMGDLNRDGRTDILISRNDAEPLVYLNNGASLSPGESTFLPGGGGLNSTVKIADFDRDSRFEPAFFKRGGQKVEYYYHAGERFIPVSAGDLTALNFDVTAATVHDFDNDGFLDVLVADGARPSSPLRMLINKRNGTFSETTGLFPSTVSGVISALSVLDFNNDQRPDIFAASGNAATPSRMLTGQSNGTFAVLAIPDLESLPATVSDVSSIDINLDGFEDLIIAYNQFAVNNVILLNTNGTSLQRLTKGAAVEHELFSTTTALVTDANNDGRPDIWYINSDYSNALFLNSTPLPSRFVAIRPYIIYPEERKSIQPGTKVMLTTVTGGKSVTQTRYIGLGTQFSSDLTAAYFGTGSAAQGLLTVVFPDGTVVEQDIPVSNGYHDVFMTFTSAESPEPSRPATPTLSAYPNPFNPSAKFHFSLPETGIARIRVVSVTGQLVSTLLDKKLSSGWHEVEWNASSLASGVYLAILEFNGTVAVKKVTLIK
jgi:hypothetical protein